MGALAFLSAGRLGDMPAMWQAVPYLRPASALRLGVASWVRALVAHQAP
ncbi:MAG TPA: hypothetical protein P5218_13265 [Planctomycetota bacterium]|nr:hypothetical protein [Planctomycetota bacterium]